MGSIKIPRLLWVAALFFGVGLLIYSNSFYTQYQFDDVTLIQDEPVLKSFMGYLSHWNSDPRFLTHLSFALNHALGESLLSYHVVNLTAHILTSLFVFGLVRVLFQTPRLRQTEPPEAVFGMALGAGLIFLCHPIQTQSVTYLWQRATVLAAFFYILTLILYVRARSQHKPLDYALCIASAVLAQWTKETAMTLPLMIVCVEGVFFGFTKKNLLQYTVAILILGALALAVPWMISGGKWQIAFSIKAMYRPQISASRYEYLLTEISAFVTYLRLLVLPVKQILLYDYPIIKSVADPRFLGSAGLLVSLLAAGFVLLRKNRLAAFCVFWFFILLSIELGPIRMPVFEHRLYPVTAGWAILAAWLLWKFFKDRKSYFLALGLITVLYSAATFQRNEVWRTPVSLWEDTVRKSPNQILALNNLGILYAGLGRQEEAKALFEKNLKLHADQELPNTNMGVYYLQMNEFDKALELLNQAVKINPEAYTAWTNLGNTYLTMRQFEMAVAAYERALAVYGSLPNTHNHLADAYAALGDFDKASIHYQKALSLDPKRHDVAVKMDHLLKINQEGSSAAGARSLE